MEKFYKTFDLPTKHLDAHDYIPPRTRNRDEAERRRMMPTGTLLLEQQAKGLTVANQILAMIDGDDREATDFATTFLAVGALNSSWYTYAKNGNTMRRRLELPRLANESGEEEWRQTRGGLFVKASDDLFTAQVFAGQIAERKATRRLRQNDIFRFGQRLGNLSLELATIPVAGGATYVSPEIAQDFARRRSLEIVELSRDLVAETGVHPSIAQLANPDSPMSRTWRDMAPDGAFDALEFAQAA